MLRFAPSSLLASLLAVYPCSLSLGAAPRLKVSENRRFLVNEDGSPFFYLGNTAWEAMFSCRANNGGSAFESAAGRRLSGNNGLAFHKDWSSHWANGQENPVPK